jgi:endo-1,4-beta-D-glucanase Y
MMIMCYAKRRKTLFVFFLVASLVLTTTLGAAPNLSQAKKKKQGITVTNKMTKGVLVIREKKKLQLKLKLRGKKVSSKKIKKIFKFRSSNKKIVTVNKKGKIYAKKAGNAKVYITQKAKGKKKKCKLKVKVVAKKNKPVVTVTTESTKQPTVDQTKQPTVDQTKQPTAEPTKQPTAEPTKQPAAEPTKQPTAEPTKQPTAEPTKQPTAEPTPSASQEPQLVNSGECSKMTCGGSYAGVAGDKVVLYSNGDYCSTSYEFEGTNKKYRMVVKGASSNSSTASVSVYIGGKKVGTVGFTGTTLSEQSLEFKMTDVTGKQEIKFLLETDNGSNDTYVNSYELYYIGDVKPLPDAPIPASVGAVSTGKYRNLFKELGYSDAEIDKKVESAWQKFFYGTDDERIYYPVGEDMAYIYTADTDDVRSEGMSYGMMICVQMDKQEEFNRLWKWAKTYMQHTSGEFKGYFAWQMNTNGTKKDNTPAADGEEYFATSLLFASARWGNGEGIYNYNKEAQEILTTMLHQADDGQGVNMFNKEHKMPVFCPIGNAATYSDPSYHLPAFYEVWAREAEQDKDFWSEAAEASRQHFKDATNEKTGLGPDYSEYSGAAKNEGNHGDFRFDAWRIAANIACDYAWWAQDDWATTHANRIQSFFYDQGVDSYGNQWSLDGKNLSPDHSPGLVAMNATASLASSDKKSWSFLEDLWNISPTTGKYRYYDGCLYMMGLLHCSGKFRAYLSSNTPEVGVVNGKISTTNAEFDLSADKKEDVTTKLILNGVRTLSEIRNDKTVLEKGKDYTISDDTVSIRKEYLSKQAVGVTKLTFVFDAGKNAVMSITIKDSKLPDVPAVSGPFDKIKATDCTADSKDIKVEDGKVTLNTTDSYIAFDIDFGSETAKSITTYVKEPNNSGQLFVRIGSLTSSPARIYNLGNGSWKEINSSLWPTVTGKTKIYIQANKPGVQIDWIQFGK